MIEVDIQQLQMEIMRLVEEGKKQEMLLLVKDGEPIAHLSFMPCHWAPSEGLRPMGLAKGLVEIHPSFYDPLPPDILAAFEGRES